MAQEPQKGYYQYLYHVAYKKLYWSKNYIAWNTYFPGDMDIFGRKSPATLTLSTSLKGVTTTPEPEPRS